MDIEKVKMALRVITTLILIVEDVFWIMVSGDDFDKWWAKACLIVNLLVFVVGAIATAIWAWT